MATKKGTKRMDKHIEWSDDTMAEQVLSEKKIPFETRQVKIKEIDFVRSRANRGRLEDKLDQDRVNDYGVAMLDGAKFPRLVMNQQADGSYFILSGVHRSHAAHEAGLTSVEAYCIKTTDLLLLDMLPMLFNLTHGVNVSSESRFAQAKYLVDTYDIDRKTAARDLRVNYHAFCEYLRAVAVMSKLQEMGVDGAKLPRYIVIKLNTLTNDNVFREAGSLLARFRVDGPRSSALIDQLKEQGTETGAMAIIKEMEEALLAEQRPSRPGTTTLSIRNRLLRQVQGLLNMLMKAKSRKAIQVTDSEDVEVFRGKLAAIHERAVALFGEQESNKEEDRPAGREGKSANGEKGSRNTSGRRVV